MRTTRELVSGNAAFEAAEIVFALCHEIGNLLAAVRLQAHLIDSDVSARELAAASVDIDQYTARASALLTHVRPLMSADAGTPLEVEPGRAAAILQQAIEDHGTRGVRVDWDCADDLAPVRFDPENLNNLLLTLCFDAIEAARPSGCVVVVCSSVEGGTEISIADDGDEEDGMSEWRSQARRGRPLSWIIAECVLRKGGADFAVARESGRTTVRITLPTAS
ncbi:MAG: hypothetical protein MJE66_05470 [Proteobacteria bacterium]|nr:hypothetical protein [Pseudomonadota bacterium]